MHARRGVSYHPLSLNTLPLSTRDLVVVQLWWSAPKKKTLPWKFLNAHSSYWSLVLVLNSSPATSGFLEVDFD